QTKRVLVHTFVCPGTIEAQIDGMIQDKRSLAQELISEEAGLESYLTNLSNEELLQTLSLDAARATFG
ncbi:MAG: hypothetical protein AAGJ31_10115, partial [Verrucomicrobiota bacterium]